MNQEQRNRHRKHAGSLILVTDAIREQPMGRVGNLSLSGMMLISPQALRDDALYQLQFQLPGADGRAHTLEVGAHEQWSEAAGTPGQFWSGLHFIGLSEADESVLAAWLDRN